MKYKTKTYMKNQELEQMERDFKTFISLLKDTAPVTSGNGGLMSGLQSIQKKLNWITESYSKINEKVKSMGNNSQLSQGDTDLFSESCTKCINEDFVARHKLG